MNTRIRTPRWVRASRVAPVLLTPMAVSLLLAAGPAYARVDLFELVAVIVGLVGLIWFGRRPDLTIRLLIIVLPFQLLILSTAYQMGFPRQLVRALGLWKELAAAALVLAAWRSAARAGRRLDRLDFLALGFVVLGAVYFAVPGLVVGQLGSSLGFDVRWGAWRVLVLPLLLLVAVRHLRLSVRQLRQVVLSALVVGVLLGALGTFEFAFSDLWNRILVENLGVVRYLMGVLDVTPAQLNYRLDDIRVYGEVGTSGLVRIGGPTLSFLQMSFALLVPAGLLLEHRVRGSRPRLTTFGLPLVVLGVLLTQTRSSVAGLLVMAVAVTRPGAGRRSRSRIRYGILVSAALLIAAPLYLGAGMSARFTEGAPGSDQAHVTNFNRARSIVSQTPLGRGLGSGTRSGSKEVAGAVTSENYFLDVGIQLGWLGMVLFIAVIALLIRRLRMRADASRDDGVQTALLGVRLSFIALLIPSWYLLPFSTPEVSWVAFMLAGAALGAADAELERGQLASHESASEAVR